MHAYINAYILHKKEIKDFKFFFSLVEISKILSTELDP